MLKTLLVSTMIGGFAAAGQADLAADVTSRISSHFEAVVAFADVIRSGGRPVWQLPAGRDGRAGGSQGTEVVSFVIIPAKQR